MSALPEDRDREGSSRSTPGRSGDDGADHVVNGTSRPSAQPGAAGTTSNHNGIAQSSTTDAEDPRDTASQHHAYGYLYYNDADDYTETDTKDLTRPLSEPAHPNTPASVRRSRFRNGGAGPSVASQAVRSRRSSPQEPDSETDDAREANGRPGDHVNGTESANNRHNGHNGVNGVNGVNHVEASNGGSSSGSPASPTMTNGTNSNPRRPGVREHPATQTESTEHGRRSPLPISVTFQNSHSSLHSDSQGHVGEQGNDVSQSGVEDAVSRLEQAHIESDTIARSLTFISERRMTVPRNEPNNSRSQLPTTQNPSSMNPIAAGTRMHAGPSLSTNPSAQEIVRMSQQSGSTSQGIVLPRWQPDEEATQCPICQARFGMFLRRHHCRKCGRVVCDGCSPHRITIPHAFIVRSPSDQSRPPVISRDERDLANLRLGGGERVRLCNPCVPDPNTTPPGVPQQVFRPPVVSGRGTTSRTPNAIIDAYGPSVRSHYRPTPPSLSNIASSRIRSATAAAAAHAQAHPFEQTSPSSNRLSLYHASHSPSTSSPGRFRASSASSPGSGLNRPLPSTPAVEREIAEEDVCPVCHQELPSRTLPNYESLRENHINNCITFHSNTGASLTAVTTGPRSHGTPPQRTTRRTRMFPYVATEKDCDDDAECIICLEEFRVGDEMARLECFCRFHRSCIDSWFVGHPGRCPVHQHDSFGY